MLKNGNDMSTYTIKCILLYLEGSRMFQIYVNDSSWLHYQSTHHPGPYLYVWWFGPHVFLGHRQSSTAQRNLPRTCPSSINSLMEERLASDGCPPLCNLIREDAIGFSPRLAIQDGEYYIVLSKIGFILWLWKGFPRRFSDMSTPRHICLANPWFLATLPLNQETCAQNWPKCRDNFPARGI